MIQNYQLLIVRKQITNRVVLAELSYVVLHFLDDLLILGLPPLLRCSILDFHLVSHIVIFIVTAVRVVIGFKSIKIIVVGLAFLLVVPV